MDGVEKVWLGFVGEMGNESEELAFSGKFMTGFGNEAMLKDDLLGNCL